MSLLDEYTMEDLPSWQKYLRQGLAGCFIYSLCGLTVTSIIAFTLYSTLDISWDGEGEYPMSFPVIWAFIYVAWFAFPVVLGIVVLAIYLFVREVCKNETYAAVVLKNIA